MQALAAKTRSRGHSSTDDTQASRQHPQPADDVLTNDLFAVDAISRPSFDRISIAKTTATRTVTALLRRQPTSLDEGYIFHASSFFVIASS